MGLFDKMKDLVLGAEDEDSFEGIMDENYEETPAPQKPKYDPIESFDSYEAKRAEKSKVVDFNSASSYTRTAAAPAKSGDRPHVVVAKLERFEDVGEIAKNINEKRMVIINLENADNATTQRIIDFIYGVTIANSSELKRVAFRTYIIKPSGYDYTGGDGFDSNNMDGIVFGN
ncbi:MAG: cell division protein SepF [Ruminococcaceae bacterium]|nr:cell division protein SepF [Oscillospiraceae bacterium]